METTSPSDPNQGNQPDPVWHKRISLLKSGLRLGASICLFVVGIYGGDYWIAAAGSLFFTAEIFGIIEELV